jgi:hypothetical protein
MAEFFTLDMAKRLALFWLPFCHSGERGIRRSPSPILTALFTGFNVRNDGTEVLPAT